MPKRNLNLGSRKRLPIMSAENPNLIRRLGLLWKTYKAAQPQTSSPRAQKKLATRQSHPRAKKLSPWSSPSRGRRPRKTRRGREPRRPTRSRHQAFPHRRRRKSKSQLNYLRRKTLALSQRSQNPCQWSVVWRLWKKTTQRLWMTSQSGGLRAKRARKRKARSEATPSRRRAL